MAIIAKEYAALPECIHSVHIWQSDLCEIVKCSDLFGQVRSISMVYRIKVSCCFLLFQACPICVVERLPIKCGMRPVGVVEYHPVLDDASRPEAVSNLFEINRLQLERPPQPLDEDVVEVSSAC